MTLQDRVNQWCAAHAATYSCGESKATGFYLMNGERKVGAVFSAEEPANVQLHEWVIDFYPDLALGYAPSSVRLDKHTALDEALYALTSQDHDDKVRRMSRVVTVRITPRGQGRILDYMDGMVFVVDNFTKGLMGPVAHVRDYRYIRDDGKPQTWSVSADGYEVVQ